MGLVEVVYEGHPETDIYVYAFSCMFFKQLVRTRTHGSVGKRHVSKPCVCVSGSIPASDNCDISPV
jgi:hypothetical protein